MKIILSLLLLLTLLNASDISYSFQINTKSPYRNQAVFLDVNISQEEHAKVMLFKFNLKESPNYIFYQIGFKENDEYHNLKHQYKYLIYPKKEGKVALSFELIKSLTDDDKVAYAISGDRDNVKGLVKNDIRIEVEPLLLNVKALPPHTDLVGNYTLKYTLDKISTSAYEPVYLNVLLKGKGLVKSFSFYDNNSTGYHLFTQKPKETILHHAKGTSSKIEWDYAFSAKESFLLPKVILKAFNPTTEKSYELVIPKQTIEVKALELKSLVDKEDYPPSVSVTDWSWLGWLFSYIMVFLAGFLMPRDTLNMFLKKGKRKEEIESLEAKVASTKTHRELLKLLLSMNDEQHKEAILLLERVVYKGEKIALTKIKEMFVIINVERKS